MTAQKATFGAGCFWGVEAAFRRVEGVTATRVGYAGGHVDHPTYEQVCSHATGHAEVVEVEFDPERVSYDELLDVFWNEHDPTPLRDNYRSVVFFHDERQAALALASRERLERARRWPRPVATTIEPAPTFWPAEERHQRYLEKRGRAACTADLARA